LRATIGAARRKFLLAISNLANSFAAIVEFAAGRVMLAALKLIGTVFAYSPLKSALANGA
jgi:hypothetical protein